MVFYVTGIDITVLQTSFPRSGNIKILILRIGLIIRQVYIETILEESSIKAQYTALQNQLNPHFLFNSLNTLISEIEYNPENAVVFTQKLSDVYRYILKSQEQGLVTLRDELEFLDSYIYLHQVRLGKCIQLENKMTPTLLNKKIPSLTLQLLIENVIKHNIINMENPMVIHLDYSDKDQTLSVRNKIKLKKDVAKSGMGLKIGRAHV